MKKPLTKVQPSVTSEHNDAALDNPLQMPYTTAIHLDADGRLWAHLGSTRRCLLQIVNGRIVFRFRDAKLDGSIPQVRERGRSANLDAVVKGARAQVHGDQLVVTIPILPTESEL